MEKINNCNFTIAVMGVGYVGRPLINELAKNVKVIAYDINNKKISKLSAQDSNENILYTSNEKELYQADVIIVCVPTPIDSENKPNLKFIDIACETIGKNMKKGTLIIFESSYMPTCTEEHCVPLLEKYSNFKCGQDFHIGYSPERINPGDKLNTLNTITKLISSSSNEVLDLMEEIYSKIEGIKLYKIKDIKIAEMSKLLENCQRDINIAFMNEMSKLCHQLGIDVNDVINAASTKWNFMSYYPGLVGGDCVGVNSYYLMSLAEKYDETLSVLKTARNVNLEMPKFIVNQLDKIIEKINSKEKTDINVTIYGYTYKENIADIRNTRVFDLYNELINRGYKVKICDYNVMDDKTPLHIEQKDIYDNDVVILAVPHSKYSNWSRKEIIEKFNFNSKYKIFMDLKSKYNKDNIPNDIIYWNL